MADHEEFNHIFNSLTVSGRQKVQGLIENRIIDQERFCDLYQLYEHNLATMKGNSATSGQVPLQTAII